MPSRAKGDPAYPVTPDWCARVRERLQQMGKTQEWLADRCGCSPAAISDLIKCKRIQSKLVPGVHAALGWDAPAPPVAGEDANPLITRLVDVAHHLDEPMLSALVEFASNLARNRKSDS
jgi:hypothetical protein